MTVMEIVSAIAIVVSPIIALILSILIQDRKEKRREAYARKMNIFSTLIANRHRPIVEDNVRALNMIDVVFCDESSVLNLWHEYFDMLCNEGYNKGTGLEQRNKKYLDLLYQMAKVLGYEKALRHLDVDRIYRPIGLGVSEMRTDEILNELLRVLKATASFPIVKKTSKLKKN